MLGFKNREIIEDGWSECYYDLHDGMFSMVQNGLVVVHADNIWLTDVKFAVQPAGNRRVRESGVKNVHAYVRGHYKGHDLAFTEDYTEYLTSIGFKPAYYNPHTCTSFVDFYTGEELKTASVVVLINKKIFYR